MNSHNAPEVHGKNEHKCRFSQKLEEYINRKKYTKIKTEEKYKAIKEAVQKWKNGEKFVNDQVRRNYATRFQSSVINGKTELLRNKKIVLTPECAFEKLYVAHSTSECCGRDAMWTKVKRYYGITQELVTLFISCCSICRSKEGRPKKRHVVKPLISSRRNRRCQTSVREYNSQDIVDQTELGEGGQATALLCTFKGNYTPLVIKKFRENEWNDEVEKEICNLITITGTNFVRLLGILVDSRRRLGIVMEYCEGVSLDKIACNREDHYTYVSVLEWMLQATNGLQFLHERRIIHRNVKPSNMLLSQNRKHLKLDMSPNTWTSENQYENPFNGRDGFRAWEIEDGEDYTFAADIFSLGRSLWNLLHKQLAASFCRVMYQWPDFNREKISRSVFPWFQTKHAPYIKECLRRACLDEKGCHFWYTFKQYLKSPKENLESLGKILRKDIVKYSLFSRSLKSSRAPATPFMSIIAEMTAPIIEERLNINAVNSKLFSMLKNTAFEDSSLTDQIETIHPVYKRSGIRLLNLIKDGLLAQLYLVNVGDNRYPVVYKDYTDPFSSSSYICEEVFALCTLSSHDNIVRLLGMTKHGPLITGLLLEHCKGGDLLNHIKEDSYQVIEKDILYWMSQAASALLFAHQKGFVHCDVRPSHMLLCSQKKKLQICGFYFAVYDESKSNRYHLKCNNGTEGFTAPEIEDDEKIFTNGIDVFSLGRTIWQLIYKKDPTDQEIELSLNQQFDIVSNELIEFMKEMMSPEATDRPTMEEVHKFLGTRIAFETGDSRCYLY